MIKIKSIEILRKPSRISSIDFFRAIAILLVLFYHFHHIIPFGEIGVDLFFVISGLLVGGILIRQFNKDQKINFFQFFLSRGFKIWPSYFLFVIISFIINQRDFYEIGKYIFFYQNYTGEASHLWSLCVEEHFYIFLPLIFILIQKLFSIDRQKMLVTAIIGMIVMGIIFKFISFYFTNSQDTFSATHNRIDALAWGVLLAWLIHRREKWKVNLLAAFLGLILIGVSIYFAFQNTYFNQLVYHSIVPFGFFLMLYGLYAVNFSNFKIMRFIAYYSYNLYLWHVIFGGYIIHNYSYSIGFVFLYLAASILAAIVVTILVEEPFLRWRNKLLAQKPTL